MKVSARLLVKQAIKYGHAVSIIDTRPNVAYLLATNPILHCPNKWRVIASFPITHRYAVLCRNRVHNVMFHPHK